MFIFAKYAGQQSIRSLFKMQAIKSYVRNSFSFEKVIKGVGNEQLSAKWKWANRSETCRVNISG